MPNVHRSSYVVAVLGGFIGGIALVSCAVVGPMWGWLLLLIGVVCIGIRKPRYVLFGALVLGGTLGMWRASTVLARPSALWDLAGDKPKVTLTGYATTDFEPTANGGRYFFRVFTVEGDTGRVRVDDRVLVLGPEWIRPRQGQIFSISGTLQRPMNIGDEFDYVAYLAKEGVHARMYYPEYGAADDSALSRSFRWRAGVEQALAAVRARIAESIGRAVPQPMASYLAGILVGAKGLVAQDLKDAFARTGTSHILAISGYNITIIAAIVVRMLRPLGRRRAYLGAVFGIGVFVVLVGAGASVVRAAIMGLLALSAQQVGRAQSAGSALIASAAVMCAVNPMLLRWDVGFQLSFLAVLGIVYVETLVRPCIVRAVRWEPFAALIATTTAAQVMVLPLLLYDFGTLAVYTLPANILVLPLVPLAMALGLATAVTGLLVPVAGQLIGQSAWLVAAYQLSVIRWFSALPYAALEVHISATLAGALYVSLAVGLVAVYRRRVPSSTA